MISTSLHSVEELADFIADRVVRKLVEKGEQVLISREELAKLTGLGIRTIDRMAKGGSWEMDKQTQRRYWRKSSVLLTPIRQGGRVLFDKAASLSAIKNSSN